MIARHPAAWWLLAISLVLAHPAALRAAGTVTLDSFDLPPGASVTIEFEVDIANPVTGGANMVMNQGTVMGGNFADVPTDDPDTGAPADKTITQLLIQADLTVAKSDSPDPVDAAAALTYTLAVSNNGPDPASNVTVTDTLPAGVTFGSASGTGWSCNHALGVVTCTRPGLAPGAAPAITINVTAPNEGGAITNNVCVASDTSDPVPGNNCDAENTTVTARADLSVTKGDAPDPVNAAAALTYTLNVSNAGPSTAASLTVTDTLPAGVTFGSAAGTGWSCGEALGVVTCTRASLAVGAAPAITINVTAPSEGGTITNNVCVATTTSDPVAPNNCDSEQTTVTAQADLSVTKADSLDPVNAASALSYTLSVSNAGPSTAASVTVTDTLPAGVTFGSAAGTGWSCGEAALVVTCTRASLAVGAAPVITINVTAPDQGGSIVNNVCVATATADPVAGNNCDAETTSVTAVADIAVDKDDGVTSVSPGGATTYTITVENLGPSDAPSVSVTDTFPAALTGCGWTSVAAGATGNTNNAGPANLSDTLNMPAGSSVTYTVDCDIDSGATGTITNQVCASSTVNDPDSGNDCDDDVNDVQPLDYGDAPDSYSTLFASNGARHVVGGALFLGALIDEELNGQPTAGANGDDTTGVDDEDGVVFTTALVACESASADVTATTAGGVLNAWIDWNANGNWSDVGEQIATNLALAAGSNTVSFTVPCTATLGASYARFRVSTASGLSFVGQAANGEVEDYAVTITAVGDLSVTKTDGVLSAIPGTALVYTIVASNAGPSPLAGVSLTDTFPAVLSCGWTSVAAGLATGNTNNAGPANLAETLVLPVGSSVTYTVTCAINPSAAGTLSNTATIAATLANTSDPNLANNTATDNNTVLTPQADVAITKTDGAASEVPGTPVTYMIVVTNNGPSNAPSVAVNDTFPVALTSCGWTSLVTTGVASGNTNNAGPANLADTLNMSVGSAVTYTVTCDIDPAATGTLVNTATATPVVTDPTPANNTATDTDTLTPQADVSITKTDGAVSEVPGTSVTYMIVVTNNGPSDDPSVAVADTFPAALTGCGWTSVAAGATGNTNNAGPANLADTLDMPAGSSVTYTATCIVNPGATGTLVNTATATTSVTDPTPANNTATDTDTLTPQADVSITKTDGAASEVPGTPVTYTIVVTNNGPSNAPSVAVNDTFPAALTGCGWTSLVTTGVASGNTNNAGPANLADTLNMSAGSAVTYTATCDVDPGATGMLVNTATATPVVTDPVPANNTATDTDTLTPETDLEIVKIADLTVVQGGEMLKYTLTVSNNGPSDATGVTIVDVLPAEVTFSSASVGCSLTTPPDEVTCTIASFPDGAAPVSFDIFVTVAAPPLPPLGFSNTATVTGNETDPLGANNTSTVTLTTDVVPPEVTAVLSAAGTFASCGPTVRVEIAQLELRFSEELQASASNPVNYRLFATGPDFEFANVGCGPLALGDVPIAIDGVTYQADTPMAPESTATLQLNGGAPLPNGLYRLVACGTGALVDLAGNELDGDDDSTAGGDFVVDFRVDAGNLFETGHFDCADGMSALVPWQSLPPAAPEVTRDTDDADTSSLSGSVLVSSGSGSGFGIAQCVEAGSLQNPYTLSGRVRVDTSLSALLGLNVSCEPFSAAGCTGTSLGVVSPVTTPLADTNDAWSLWQAEDIELPPGTVSVRCSFVIDNPLAASFDINLDQLTFEGSNVIFADGFESGDTSAWSGQGP